MGKIVPEAPPSYIRTVRFDDRTTTAWVRALLVISVGIAWSASAVARTLAGSGCPISHCTIAGSSVVAQPVTDTVTTTVSNPSMGSIIGEGCSGNGPRLMCLFASDKSPMARKGTLKAVDASTLKAIWGSAVAAHSYNLDPVTAANGQVPVMFSDGTVAAGDGTFEVLYDSSGAVIARLTLSGAGTNYGITPIGADYGVVSQKNGVLTWVDLAGWQNVGSISLTDPVSGAPVSLVGPSTASADTLYVIGYEPISDDGVLFAIGVDARSRSLVVKSAFPFTGRSGALPVVVAAQDTGLAGTLILLHAPKLPVDGGSGPNYIVGVLDDGAHLTQLWSLSMPATLSVSPVVDVGSGSFYYESGPNLRQVSLVSGALLQSFNLKTIGGFPPSFRLNGHMAATDSGGAFTLLLGAGIPPPAAKQGQYAIAFQPLISPSAFLWSLKFANEVGTYAGAWNFAPAAGGAAVCPIAISVTATKSTLVRLCDF